MIFELAQDFHNTVAAMPKEHPRHRILELLEEAIRRDIHFIARYLLSSYRFLDRLPHRLVLTDVESYELCFGHILLCPQITLPKVLSKGLFSFQHSLDQQTSRQGAVLHSIERAPFSPLVQFPHR